MCAVQIQKATLCVAFSMVIINLVY